MGDANAASTIREEVEEPVTQAEDFGFCPDLAHSEVTESTNTSRGGCIDEGGGWPPKTSFDGPEMFDTSIVRESDPTTSWTPESSEELDSLYLRLGADWRPDVGLLEFYRGRGLCALEGPTRAAALRRVASDQRVQALRLNRCGLVDADVAAIADGAKLNTSLRLLGLSDNSIGDLGAQHLAEALEHGVLQKLHLWGNLVDDSGALRLASAISAPHARLEVLHLQKNRFGAVGTNSLRAATAFMRRERRKEMVIAV